METTTAAIASAVRADIDLISTQAKVCAATGIAQSTLARRLTTGDFTASELIAIARFLRTKPEKYFSASAASAA